ncbi:MAG: hypothetical protein Q9164_006651, partial [Protoblastenia rupestris]
MGSSTSKPSPPKEHVFTAETPVRFSPDLLQSLEQSPEVRRPIAPLTLFLRHQSDNTRASELELHIQRRVAGELRRLDAETTASIRKLEDEISASPESGTTEQPPSISGSNEKSRELSRTKVQEEIDTLKTKLQERKMREDVMGDKEVENAKEKL